MARTPSLPVEPPSSKIYAIADSGTLGLDRLDEAVVRFADVGIEWIQIRAKSVSGGQLTKRVESCLQRLEPYDCALWLDDRVDIASLLPVAGVHVGQEDLSPEGARAVLGPGVWIGHSAHDLDQVARADADPAVDVVALGPIFSTRSKERPDPVVGIERLRQARQRTRKPLVAIGGIDHRNLRQVLETGVDAVAMIGAVCREPIGTHCERLLALTREIP